MRISDRYLGKQVLLGTLYAVLILSVVLVLGNLFQKIRPLLVGQVAPLWLVTRFVLNVLPYSLMFTIPWGFLTAVLLVFGRLSSDQEITAFRVAGMSLPRLAVPVFAIGAALSGVCLYLNLNVVPLAKGSINDLLYEQAQRDPAAMLDPGKVSALMKDQRRLFVERKDGDDLVGFHLYQLKGVSKSGETSEQVYVHAGRATYVVDREKRQLRLRLADAFMESMKEDGSADIAFSGHIEPLLMDFNSKEKKSDKSNSMTNDEIRTFLKDNPGLAAKKQVEYRAEITKRYSFSMACLAFAFVAVPLGLKSRRKDTSMGLILSLLLGALYFLFSVVSAEFKTDLAATLVLWMPNMLSVLTGLVLFRKARFK